MRSGKKLVPTVAFTSKLCRYEYPKEFNPRRFAAHVETVVQNMPEAVCICIFTTDILLKDEESC
jgi:hypothetical protein